MARVKLVRKGRLAGIVQEGFPESVLKGKKKKKNLMKDFGLDTV